MMGQRNEKSVVAHGASPQINCRGDDAATSVKFQKRIRYEQSLKAQAMNGAAAAPADGQKDSIPLAVY